MLAPKAILEQWFARTLETYGAEAVPFLKDERDPFRNPVGNRLRESMAVLVEELLADGGAESPAHVLFSDVVRVQSALAEIVRIRAVQDLTATQAVGFIFLLRPILDSALPSGNAALLNRRIDQFALLAFDEYVRCRERLAEIRASERLRTVRHASAVTRGRS